MLQIYTSVDLKDNTYPLGYTHEMEGFLQLVKRLYVSLNHHSEFYAILANLNNPISADVLIFTQRGLGIIELKHHPGTITVKDNEKWYSDNHLIHAGSYINPLEQVKSYAIGMREKIKASLYPDMGIEYVNINKDRIQFQTAVCFTNEIDPPDLSVVRQHPKIKKEYKKGFKILNAYEVVDWVFNLRFNIKEEIFSLPDGNISYDQFVLPINVIERIIVDDLKQRRWEEVMDILPEPLPYGYLVRNGNLHAETYFPLKKEQVLIGRDIYKSDVAIYGKCDNVSRLHAIIERHIYGVDIVDISRNGVFINGNRITSRYPLRHGDLINLGGLVNGLGTCSFVFLENLDNYENNNTTKRFAF